MLRPSALLAAFVLVRSHGEQLPPIEPRVQALLKRMTIEAKVGQLLMGGGKFDRLKHDHPDGYGVLCAHAYDGGAAKLEAQNAIQEWFLKNSTYNIPVSFWAETLHTAQSGATIFPAPVNLGTVQPNPLNASRETRTYHTPRMSKRKSEVRMGSTSVQRAHNVL